MEKEVIYEAKPLEVSQTFTEQFVSEMTHKELLETIGKVFKAHKHVVNQPNIYVISGIFYVILNYDVANNKKIEGEGKTFIDALQNFLIKLFQYKEVIQ